VRIPRSAKSARAAGTGQLMLADNPDLFMNQPIEEHAECVAAALLSARIGHDVRAAASKRVPLAAAATAEDAVALGLAAASARP
jgi:hypothetical protein